MTPLFLSLEQVLRIHCSMIEKYGGQEGIRDAGLLHSAIAIPQTRRKITSGFLCCPLYQG